MSIRGERTYALGFFAVSRKKKVKLAVMQETLSLQLKGLNTYLADEDHDYGIPAEWNAGRSKFRLRKVKNHVCE